MNLRGSILGLVGWIALSFAAALVGSRFTPSEWYAQLIKPSWTPPNAVFAPVWTVLYAMMGVAAWLVWRSGSLKAVALPLVIFSVQLALNALWSYIFFGLQRPGLAFADIVILWVAIIVTLIVFSRHSTLAGALFVPYLVWVSFAAFLNYSVWRLNP